MNYRTVIVLDPEPTIEFYDKDYEKQAGFDRFGQFVSSYYLKTLLERRRDLEARGLDLYGGEPKWKLTGEQMTEVFNDIQNLKGAL